MLFKARRRTRFQRASAACCGVFKEITVVGSNQHNYCENANACENMMWQLGLHFILYSVEYFEIFFAVLDWIRI